VTWFFSTFDWMLTQLNESAKNHEVRKFSMFRVVLRKREGKADSANAWHALRPIILVLAAYTASQNAAGAKQFLPSTYLYSVHCRTNLQFSDLVTFIFFFFSISLRNSWRCFAEHSLGTSAIEHCQNPVEMYYFHHAQHFPIYFMFNCVGRGLVICLASIPVLRHTLASIQWVQGPISPV
jgi:hypothetical protein